MHIIAGKYKNRVIASPLHGECRPTLARTRAMVFNICQQEIEGARFLDLFSGSGAMGFEALSRGAERAVFVDSNRAAIEAMHKTASSLSVQKNVQFLHVDVLDYLKRTKETFDIIYMDPPYFRKDRQEAFSVVQEALFLIDQGLMLAPSGVLFIEDSKESPLDSLSFSSLKIRSKRRCGDAFLWEFCKAALHNGVVDSHVE